MASKSKTSTHKKSGEQVEFDPRCLLPVLIAWLVPGGGHFFLKKRVLGNLLFGSVVGMFVCGLLMNGRMFEPTGNDMFTQIMNYGGYFGDLCNGLLYMITVMLGYEQELIPGAIHDYGTKFMVCSGFLNLLAMVDVYELSTGSKK